jgi:glycosyltransferase involved in cell wall biosynthesis
LKVSEARKQQPLVSILICNYNYGAYIGAAIESALAQTYDNVEVVVVDDGSTDDSCQVIRRYEDRVHAIFKENGGQPSAFNAAFNASSGDIICMLDSDDYFLSEKVERIVACYETNQDAGYVFHPLKRVGVNGVDVDAVARRRGMEWEPVQGSRPLDYRGRRNRFTAPPTTGLTMRRSLWSRFHPIPTELRILMDNYIKFVAMGLAPGYYLAEQLAVLRLHGNNLFSMAGNDISRMPSDVRVASAMRRNFPDLLPEANRYAAITLAKRWKFKRHGNLNETSEALNSYLAGASWGARIDVLIGGALRYVKMSLAESAGARTTNL